MAALECFLKAAEPVRVRRLPSDVGYPEKQLVVFEGGIGAIAKLAHPSDSGHSPTARIRAEAAAWVLASALGWRDLVPTTMIRDLRSVLSGADTQSSVQVWTANLVVQSDPHAALTYDSVSASDLARCAVFDLLVADSDRRGNGASLAARSGTRIATVVHPC
jgi:hypothetical protein